MLFLKRNLPNWERALRVLAGLGLVGAALGAVGGLGVLTAGPLKFVALASAATLILTAFVGFCPACALVGRRYLDDRT